MDFDLPENPEEGTTLMISYWLKRGNKMLPDEFCMGFDHIILAEPCQELPAISMGNVKFIEQGHYLSICGQDFDYTMDLYTGLFISLRRCGQELLQAPMGFCTYRAPIDNDRWIRKQWEEAGYDRLQPRVTNFRTEENQIYLKINLQASGLRPSLHLILNWTVSSDGTLRCSLDGSREETMPWLPRFGVVLPLPKAANLAEYYGYGPGESYVDSHCHAWLANFENRGEFMEFSYLRPQEGGSHWNCYQVNMGAFRITARQPFSFCASPYSVAELMEAKHDYELPESSAVYCHIDYKMSGIGSNSCGPELEEAYRFSEETFHWEFFLECQI